MIAFGAEPMELMLDRPARTDHAAVELAYATDNLPLVRDILQSWLNASARDVRQPATH